MHATATDAPAPAAPRPRVVGPYLRFAAGFWTGEARRTAWLLTAAVALLLLSSLGVQVAINRWNRSFFDALERKDTAAFAGGVGLILALGFASALLAVLLVHARMRTQLRWREWMTGALIGRWLGERRFYQLTVVGGEGGNPEGRIAEDARLAIEPLVDFAIGLTYAVLMAVVFVGVLWSVGGALDLRPLGLPVTVPGFMVIGAVLYALIASTATVLINRPLIRAVESKNGGEQGFRYELTRVRESAESIALVGGDDSERARLKETFAELAGRWLFVIRGQARITWITNANAVLVPVVPLLLAAPKYLAGELSLGALMQVAAAFVQVQAALNWLVDNSIRVAEWLASATRVAELRRALAALDEANTAETIVLGDAPDDAIHLEALAVSDPDGKSMIDAPEVVIGRGEKVLVKGASGTGKSTLIRAMAGLWPWGSGRILRPAGARVAFLPQRPYLPLGTLRGALAYPREPAAVADEAGREALAACGLSHLAGRLDDEEPWDRLLSGGEQQRLAFARLLLDPPDVIIMDEATSALDEESQARMMGFLAGPLSAATVLSVGHRPGLEAYHAREIALVREPGARVATPRSRRYRRMRNLFGLRPVGEAAPHEGPAGTASGAGAPGAGPPPAPAPLANPSVGAPPPGGPSPAEPRVGAPGRAA